MRLRRAVGALAERNFRLLFASSTISGLGDGISIIALVVRRVAGVRLGDRARARHRGAADRRCGDRACRRRLGRPAPAPHRPDRRRGRPGHRAGDHRRARPDRLRDDRDARRPAGDLRARRRFLPAHVDRTDPGHDQPWAATAGERVARTVAGSDPDRRPGDRRRDRRGRQSGLGASDRRRVLCDSARCSLCR